jgi:hypothetical protein
MSPDPFGHLDLETFTASLDAGIAGARSLEEITAWLASQTGVQSVRLADYLLKSNPPQRDFVVEFATPGGATLTRIVNVVDLGNQRFQFRTLRDR